MIMCGVCMSIQNVKSEIILEPDIRKKIIWKNLSDLHSFNGFIPGVDKIRIVSQSNTECKSEWYISIDGAPFSWLEIDTFNDLDCSIQFEAVSGDFDQMYGDWRLTSFNESQYKISYNLNYRLGIPIIEDIVGNTLLKKMQYFADTMLSAFAQKVKAQILEERFSKRITLNKKIKITTGHQSCEVEIVNISFGGMLIRIKDQLQWLSGTKQVSFRIDDEIIDGYCFSQDDDEATRRIVFLKPLTPDTITKLLDKWDSGVVLSDDMIRIYDVITTNHDAMLRNMKLKTTANQ